MTGTAPLTAGPMQFYCAGSARARIRGHQRPPQVDQGPLRGSARAARNVGARD